MYYMNAKMNFYQTPEIEIVDIDAEGVLCASGNLERWEEQTLGW